MMPYFKSGWSRLSLLLATVLSACTSTFVQVIDPANVPRQDTEVVIHCYLSPQDTVLTAIVNRSRTVLGEPVRNQTGSTPDATVTLSNGSRSVELHYDGSQKVPIHRVSARTFPILAGKTYTLKARLATGETATATCTVPVPVPIAAVRIDSLPNLTDADGRDYYVNFSWRDPAGIANFYRVAGDSEYGTTRTETVKGKPVTVAIRAVDQVSFDDLSPCLTDQNQNGRSMVSLPGRLPFVYSAGKIQARPPVLVNAYLLNVDVHYYQYHESLERAVRAEGNPFAEPALITSNVRGGLGCFGAYNRTKVTVRFR